MVSSSRYAWRSARGLVRRFGERRALAAAAVLYIIGLFGDSYYGLAEQLSGVRCFYTQLFLVSDHTRNGIFFAPLFFVLGGILAQTERKRLSVCVQGFCVSFSLMLAEALLLRRFSLQRHDSMYLPSVLHVLFIWGAAAYQGQKAGVSARRLPRDLSYPSARHCHAAPGGKAAWAVGAFG